MIDYIIIKTNKRQNVLRSRVFRGAECGTDHRLMKAVVKVTPKAIHKKYKPAVRFNNRCLQNETTRKEFLENIHRNASQVRPDSIQEKWKNIQTTFISAANSVLERTKSINRDWFDESNDEVSKLLEKKDLAHKTFLAVPSRENEVNFKRVRRHRQKEVRKLKNQWWSDRANEMQRYMDTGDSYNLYQSIKALVGPVKKPLNVDTD